MTVTMLPRLDTTNAYDRYKWEKSAAGTWERAVDEAERFYAALSREPSNPEFAEFPITASSTFTAPVEDSARLEDVDTRAEMAFRDAWLALRSECPTIASWIQHDPKTKSWKRCYESFHDAMDYDAPKDEWLSTTFQPLRVESSIEDWFNTDPPTYKRPTLFFVRRTTPSDGKGLFTGAIFLRCCHDLIDAHGLLQLMNRLYDLAAKFYTGFTNARIVSYRQEIERLCPPVKVAAHLTASPSPTVQDKFDHLKIENIKTQTNGPFLGLPISGNDSEEGRSSRQSATLSRETSARLLTKCKAKGYTITHALSAALVLALRNKQPAAEAGTTVMRYAAQAIVSLRHLDRPDVSSSLANAATNYHMIAPTTVASDVDVSPTRPTSAAREAEEFDALAAQFREYYVSVRPPAQASSPTFDPDLLEMSPMMWDFFREMLSAAKGAAVQPMASVGVSSLGNISSLVRADRSPFALTDAWVSGEGVGSSIPVMIQTFEGRVGVSAMHKTQYFDGDFIKVFLDEVLATAVACMGL